ncbi:MAG: hypothetical protein P8168_10930 [Deltaproteobacteria bacterium]
MPSTSNQRIERHYFELFRRIFQLPNGQVKYGDKPDVIIEGKKRIGIEVTRFFLERGELPQSEQNQRRIRENVIKKAHHKYMEKGGKYEISFSFDKDYPIRYSKNLISKIVDVIFKLEASRTGAISKYFLNDIPELSFMYINPNMYTDPQWRITQLHDVQLMSVSRLKDIVREKENKAKNYNKCDAYWLLVVVDFIDPAQDQEIQIDGVELRSNFYEKIIIYKTAFEHVLEL